MSSSLETPLTVTRQASLSMSFSRQEYWNGLLFPSPKDLPNQGIKLRTPASQADSIPSEPSGKSQVAQSCLSFCDPWTITSRLLCPWNCPAKNTGVGSPSLLQGIFLTQGSNPSLSHCRWIFLPSEPLGIV